MRTIGERLRWALEHREISIRAFQQEMHSMQVPGSSYPAVHRYLKGETTPSVEFLMKAAGFLKVRPAWLIVGDGFPTEEEQLEELKYRIPREILLTILKIATKTAAALQSSSTMTVLRPTIGERQRATEVALATLLGEEQDGPGLARTIAASGGILQVLSLPRGMLEPEHFNSILESLLDDM